LGAVARLLRMLLLTANASAQPANARARRTIRDMMLLIGAGAEKNAAGRSHLVAHLIYSD
jgi:hypothetical protein